MNFIQLISKKAHVVCIIYLTVDNEIVRETCYVWIYILRGIVYER